MAAMFTRQKSIGWASVILALQGWLNETPAAVEAGKQPAFFAVGMSLMALFIVSANWRDERGWEGDGGGEGCGWVLSEDWANRVQTYMPIFFPPPGAKGATPVPTAA